MEVRFKRYALEYLDTVLQENRSLELTREIRLPEGMPDAARILCTWGQPILRGKEWDSGTVSASGGLMVWILYTDGEGGPEQCMEGWIPFQMRWDLPEECPDGCLQLHCCTRFVDVRAVTPRKLMVRAGVGFRARALIPAEVELAEPSETPENVEVKISTWPVHLNVEAGEKTFALEEQIHLQHLPEKLLCCRLEPKITENRVVGDKLAFRGLGNLHVVYRCREGQIHSQSLEQPFSVLAELQREYGTDVRADLTLAPTALETELEEDGTLRFRGGLTGQYTVTDRCLLSLAEDGYSPGRQLTLEQEERTLPAVLEERRETFYGEQMLPADVREVLDVWVLPDIFRQRRGEDGLKLTVPMAFQVLYRDSEGQIQSTQCRWEGEYSLPAGEKTQLWAVPGVPEQTGAGLPGGTVSCQLPVRLQTGGTQSLPMVTALTLGDRIPKAENRPSLILCRAGDRGLWDLAKDAGTTVDAIRRMNGLTEEPAPGRMLLIPVP